MSDETKERKKLVLRDLSPTKDPKGGKKRDETANAIIQKIG